jgi:hypothetical protein
MPSHLTSPHLTSPYTSRHRATLLHSHVHTRARTVNGQRGASTPTTEIRLITSHSIFALQSASSLVLRFASVPPTYESEPSRLPQVLQHSILFVVSWHGWRARAECTIPKRRAARTGEQNPQVLPHHAPWPQPSRLLPGGGRPQRTVPAPTACRAPPCLLPLQSTRCCEC